MILSPFVIHPGYWILIVCSLSYTNLNIFPLYLTQNISGILETKTGPFGKKHDKRMLIVDYWWKCGRGVEWWCWKVFFSSFGLLYTNENGQSIKQKKSLQINKSPKIFNMFLNCIWILNIEQVFNLIIYLKKIK